MVPLENIQPGAAFFQMTLSSLSEASGVCLCCHISKFETIPEHERIKEDGLRCEWYLFWNQTKQKDFYILKRKMFDSSCRGKKCIYSSAVLR